MAATTHILNIIIKVNDRATAAVRKTKQSINSMSDAVSASQARLGGWVRPIDAVTSKFKNVKNAVSATASPLFFVENKVKSITAAVAHSQQRLKGWQSPIEQVRAKFTKLNTKVISLNALVKKTTTRLQQMAQLKFSNLKNALLGVGLSFLFTGMAIKRVTDQFLKSIFNTYMQIIDVNNIFFKKTQQLSAAWAFFKFSLVDALSQSDLFLGLIDMAINFVNWLGRLSNKWKIIGVVGVIAISLLAGAMMIFGQGLLAILGLVTGLHFFGINSFAQLAGVIKTKLIPAIWNVVKSIWAAIWASLKWAGVMLGKLFKGIVGIVAKTWAWAAANWAVLGPILLIITLLLIFGVILLALKGKFGSWGNAFKSMVNVVIMSLAILSQALVTLLITPFQLLAVGIANIMELAGRKVPKFLRDFINFDPATITQSAARFSQDSAGFNEADQGTGSFAGDVRDGFRDVIKDLGSVIEEGMGNALDKRQVTINSTQG